MTTDTQYCQDPDCPAYGRELVGGLCEYAGFDEVGNDLHDLTDRELYRLSFDIAEVLVARAKCRLGEEAGVPAPVAMARRTRADQPTGSYCSYHGGYDPRIYCPGCLAEASGPADDNYGAW